jgi:hypothetical protein
MSCGQLWPGGLQRQGEAWAPLRRCVSAHVSSRAAARAVLCRLARLQTTTPPALARTQNADGESLLHVAADGDNVATLTFLLSLGAGACVWA